MGYTLFNIGDDVQINAGSFTGIMGIVAPSASAYQSCGTVVLNRELNGDSSLLPVTVAAVIDGHVVALRVPPEYLQRI